MVKSSRSPARCIGGKNAQISLGLGAGPFEGHVSSLDQERGCGGREEPYGDLCPWWPSPMVGGEGMKVLEWEW